MLSLNLRFTFRTRFVSGPRRVTTRVTGYPELLVYIYPRYHFDLKGYKVSGPQPMDLALLLTVISRFSQLTRGNPGKLNVD